MKTKGAITAKFFEFTNILCEGDLQADVLMDCSVICHDTSDRKKGQYYRR